MIHEKEITKAFTLIELLVVIAIVGILTGFIFVSMNGAVNAAKDARRQSDLATIEHAILAYMAQNNNSFPETSTSCTMGSGGTCSNLGTNLAPYLNTIPLDPNGSNYTYTYSSGTNSFTIRGTMSNSDTYLYDSSTGQWARNTSPFVGWLYKKTVTLSSTLTQDYQIKLTIPYGSGGCESHCNTDFSDLRFASVGGTTLNYWIESYTAGTTATVWVKALNGSSSFVMYYGKTGATTTASGDNTFEFFDDFNGTSLSTGWITSGSVLTSVSGGALAVTRTGSNAGGSVVNTTNSYLYYALRSKTKIGAGLSSAYIDAHVGFMELIPNYYWPSYGMITLSTRTQTANTYSSGSCYASAYTYNQISGITNADYHIFDILWKSGEAKYYIDGTLKQTHTTNIPTIAMYPGFFSQSNAGTINTDWILIRKYQTSEPSPSFDIEQLN